ncbi:unnamed protein product [Candidula unifasciata]|uniref:Uncharacterized protein n=1 Tax=Candidula unifasciata TaxID=100452 RepID=A0A8S3YBR2_9EUPU|nr:unnamed protein product [Candidula unifasciata]
MQGYSDSATEEDVFSQMEEPGESRLAKHIQDLMFGPKGRRKFPKHEYKPTGCIDYEILGDAVSSAHKPPPWLTDQVKPAGGPSEKKAKGSVFRRPRQVAEEKVKERRDRYSEYNRIITSNPYKKIAFNNSQMLRDMIPQWCQDRLRTACRSARFELPFDKTILENITPLQFLARYTRLYREQRRRYSLIFQKHKSKLNDYIEYQNLFPALNTMFGMYLSKENFDILCTALFIDRQTSLDETTFVGVCTFADRLFWTSYLEHLERDTFTFLGPNRSVLEYADFENLKRKIDGLQLSREMYYLLYSLA